MSEPESAEAARARVLADQCRDHFTYVADAVGDFPVSRADLYYAFDAYGNKLIDLSGGDGAMVTGHHNLGIVGAVHEQLVNYEHTARSGEHIAVFVSEYAKALSATFPFAADGRPQQVLFCPSEIEARQHAVALAKVVTGRRGIASIVGQPPPPNAAPSVVLPEGSSPHLVWDDVAAVMLELVNPDMTPVDMSWARLVADSATAHGAAVIIDESRTGYGRTGSLWAHQQYALDPDITVLGAAGGGGLPFGAVVASPELFGAYHIPRRQFGASPAICRAGSVVLEQLAPALLEHVTEAGHVFTDAVAELHDQFPDLIVGSHGLGLARGLVLANDVIARQFFTDAVAHGLLLRPPFGRVLAVTPPLIISEAELRHAVDVMASVCLDWVEPL